MNNDYFLTRENRNSYNFDLKEHMDSFDLYEFCQRDMRDKYGFLVITPERYYLGYNANYGEGTHMGAFARVMKEILGGGVITNENDAVVLNDRCLDEYITANLINEYFGKYYLKEHESKSYMSFFLEKKDINNKELNVFKDFYDKYNNEIIFLANHFGFKVFFNYHKEGTSKLDISNSLDNVYDYLKERNSKVLRRKFNG